MGLVVEHGAQHLVALLHLQAAVIRAVDGEDKVRRPGKAQAVVLAVGAAGVGGDVQRDIQLFLPV